MSTLLLCGQCDSLLAKLLEKCMACSSQGVENGVGWEEMVITFFICAALVYIAYIIKSTILDWKKTGSDMTSGSNKSDDKDNTIKYIEKLIDFLQSQTKEYGEKGEFKKLKAFDSPECKMYNAVLVCLIAAQQGKTINIDDLTKALNSKQEQNSKEGESHEAEKS